MQDEQDAIGGWFAPEAVAAREALRDSAVSKLVAGQSLTEDEARLMVGATPSFTPDDTASTLETPNPEGTP
jgi:hypothetical protein